MIRILAIGVLLLVPPLLGVYLSGKPLETLFDYPPDPESAEPRAFSWPAFWGITLFVLLVVSPFLIRGFRRPCYSRGSRARLQRFPWWGWFGLLLGLGSWVLAWNRFPWLEPLQRHTFAPLWLGFIVTVNGLTQVRSGHCMLRNRPVFFLTLFPVSAAFWWCFEFLNRVVHNWLYLGIEVFSATEYVLFATISFATVLPAVLSTAELLGTFPWFHRAFRDMPTFHLAQARPLAAAMLAGSVASLFWLSLYPRYLFPLVWISPLFIVVSVQTLTGQANLLGAISSGDWRPIGLPAVAALLCGFFWELWNFRSLAHWEYAIPLVDRFYLFHMPALGYAGYLPFGMECIAAASLISPSALASFADSPFAEQFGA